MFKPIAGGFFAAEEKTNSGECRDDDDFWKNSASTITFRGQSLSILNIVTRNFPYGPIHEISVKSPPGLLKSDNPGGTVFIIDGDEFFLQIRPKLEVRSKGGVLMDLSGVEPDAGDEERMLSLIKAIKPAFNSSIKNHDLRVLHFNSSGENRSCDSCVMGGFCYTNCKPRDYCNWNFGCGTGCRCSCFSCCSESNSCK